MKFALEVWSADFDETLRTCLAAEGLGYDGFYYGESPTALDLDCWTVLAALATSTRAIKLGPVISNLLPDYRSVLLLAKQAATVALVSGGRLDFRTGAGAARPYGAPWWEPFGIRYPAYAERLALVERSVPVLRALWSGEEVSMDPASDHGPGRLGIEAPEIPITIAAVGASGIACAAKHADVWEASYRTPEELARLGSGVEGSRPGSARRLERSLEVDVFIGRTRGEADAVLADVERQRGSADLAHVVERSLHGTPDEVAQQLRALARVGVDQLVLAFNDPHDPRALEAFARARERFEREG